MEQYYSESESFQSAPNHAVLGKRYEAEFRENEKTQWGFAVLDGEKVYFGGVCYVKENRSFEQKPVNWCASIGEILACSYLKNRRPACLILSLIFLPVGLAALIVPLIFFLISYNLIMMYLISPALGLLVFGTIMLVKFIKSCKQTYFEIRLDSVSYCYSMKSLEPQEDTMFRAAISKARAEYVHSRAGMPYVEQNSTYIRQNTSDTGAVQSFGE